ncbi:hypothetical protein Tco_0020158 [Tanacetum coccineum]
MIGVRGPFFGSRFTTYGATTSLTGAQIGKDSSSSFRPVKPAKIFCSFGHHVDLGFHLLMMVLGAISYGLRIAQGFAIGERHLPIESTIASRSTDVMMAANQTTNNNSIRSILNKEKLNGSNFLDWYRNMRIVLMNKQKLHHMEEALPEAPPAIATAANNKK